MKDFTSVLAVVVVVQILVDCFVPNSVTSKKPVKPEIIVKCKDQKCDTTYVYKLKR